MSRRRVAAAVQLVWDRRAVPSVRPSVHPFRRDQRHDGRGIGSVVSGPCDGRVVSRRRSGSSKPRTTIKLSPSSSVRSRYYLSVWLRACQMPLVEPASGLHRCLTSKDSTTAERRHCTHSRPVGAAGSRAQATRRVGRTGRGGRPAVARAGVSVKPLRIATASGRTATGRMVGRERKGPLCVGVAGCMFDRGTGAARVGSATSGQLPTSGKKLDTERAAAAPELRAPNGADEMAWPAESRSKRSVLLHSGSRRGRPRTASRLRWRGESPMPTRAIRQRPGRSSGRITSSLHSTRFGLGSDKRPT
jgi:hypothetical protein